MKFNAFMNSHFRTAGCRLIARARDECRNRDVSIYAMPGYWDVVGVSDGIDAWVCPVAAGAFFKSNTGDVYELMRALKDGHPLPPVPPVAGKPAKPRRVSLDDDEEPAPRAKTRAPLVDDSEPAPRKARREILS